MSFGLAMDAASAAAAAAASRGQGSPPPPPPVGVNTAPLTGGPQFASYNGQVAVSRFYLAALRSTGPLAGQDPLADCYVDPLVCQGVYGNYAELDLGHGVTNGVDLGTSGGDQTYVVEMAGPVSDQRISVRGDTAPSYFLNFPASGAGKLANSRWAFGPVSRHAGRGRRHAECPAVQPDQRE
jgi:hypothetical protein